jgi:uncharacterized protein
MANYKIYNCHTHVFTNKHVPEEFLPFKLLKIFSRAEVTQKLGRFISKIRSKRVADMYDRYAVFMNIGNQTEEETFKMLVGYYPADSAFVVLSMDMEFMGAGKLKEPFVKQLDNLWALKQKYQEKIFPFVAVDPRREGVLALVKDCIEKKKFQGIKLYPPLGFYPFDERLFPLYEYTERNQIPIMAHCSRGGVYYKGKITNEMLKHPVTGTILKKEKNDKFSEHFTNPENYYHVLKKFPELKVCLAHFGGQDEWNKFLCTSWDPETMKVKSWFSVIGDLVKEYKNMYTDISYTLSDSSLLPLLKVQLQDDKMRDKILFGTDFYMAEQEISERNFSVNVRAYLGEQDFKQIAHVNAERYLMGR